MSLCSIKFGKGVCVYTSDSLPQLECIDTAILVKHNAVSDHKCVSLCSYLYSKSLYTEISNPTGLVLLHTANDSPLNTIRCLILDILVGYMSVSINYIT